MSEEEGITGLMDEKKKLREECRKRKEGAYKHVLYPFSKKFHPHPECLECNARMDSEVECDIKNQILQIDKDIDLVKRARYMAINAKED